MTEIISNMVEAHVFRIRNNSLEFLLLKRAEGEYYAGLWQMVTGRIEEGEKAFQTAVREIREETGLRPLKLWTAPNINSFYSHKDDKIVMIPVFAAEVNEGSNVRLSSEHSEFKWCAPKDAIPLLAWPGQRNSVEIIAGYFEDEKHFLELVQIPLQF